MRPNTRKDDRGILLACSQVGTSHDDDSLQDSLQTRSFLNSSHPSPVARPLPPFASFAALSDRDRMASRIPASPRRGGGLQTNYAAVPQSPQTAHYLHHQHPQQQPQQPQQQQQHSSLLKPYRSARSRTHSAGSSAEMHLNPRNENTTQGVFTGHIGGAFGPYAVCCYYYIHPVLHQLTPPPVPAARAPPICCQPTL
jgi:hypothetical protein